MRVAIRDAFCGSDTARGGLSSAWLAGCAAFGGLAHWALASGLQTSLQPLASVQPMAVLAALAIIAGGPLTARRPDWLDGAMFALALLACALPFRSAAMAALAMAGGLCFRLGDTRARTTGVLLLALAGWGLKDGVWAGFASAPVLWVEAHVVAAILRWGGMAAVASGNQIQLAGGQNFVILRACSALSLAYPCAVGVYALSRLFEPAKAPGLYRVLAALGLLVVINTARLVVMAASPAAYDFLHHESGVLPLQLVWAAIVMLAALPGRAWT